MEEKKGSRDVDPSSKFKQALNVRTWTNQVNDLLLLVRYIFFYVTKTREDGHP